MLEDDFDTMIFQLCVDFFRMVIMCRYESSLKYPAGPGFVQANFWKGVFAGWAFRQVPVFIEGSLYGFPPK